MKKILILSLATVMSLIAQGSVAQTNVTIYGLISAGIARTDNVGGGARTTEFNGPNQTSRWGLKGVEDLGGGLKAVFVLENGFSVDTGTLGQGGRAFGRQSTVGFESSSLGNLSLGRQADAAAEALCFYMAGCQWGGFAPHIGDNDNLYNTYRVNNSLIYKSPIFPGIQISGQYGFSEFSQDRKNNRAYSASIKYGVGNFSIAAALNNADRPASSTNSTGGAVFADYGFSSPFVISRVGNAAVLRQRVNGIGSNYKFDTNMVSAIYTNSKFDYLNNSNLSLDNYEATVSRWLMPNLQAGVGYTYTKGKYSNNLEDYAWKQMNLGAVYFLSKRTDVSVAVIRQVAAGAGNKAYIYSMGQSSDHTQTAVAVGMRHRF